MWGGATPQRKKFHPTEFTVGFVLNISYTYNERAPTAAVNLSDTARRVPTIFIRSAVGGSIKSRSDLIRLKGDLKVVLTTDEPLQPL